MTFKQIYNIISKYWLKIAHFLKSERFQGENMLEMVSMLLIVVGVFALGDFCGVITKARLSSVFVALITMLILFMTGLVPVDIIKKAGLSEIARWGSPILDRKSVV